MRNAKWGLVPILALVVGAGAAGGALDDLAAHWAALKDVKTLQARFVCEKNLAALDTPLKSEGRIWIAKPEKGKEGGVRFSTDKPYVSELILTDGKVYARSQHEEEWTKTNQSGRPGLTAVMSQLGGWSTGDAAKISEMYSAARGQSIPSMPGGENGPAEADVFILTPTNKDLAKAVKQVTLGIDRATHYLRYIEILTMQDDSTRYWFYDVKTNAPLPPEIFKPGKELSVPEDAKP